MTITIRPPFTSFAGEVSGLDIDWNEVRDVRRTSLAGHAPTVEQEPPA
jgi:hypothetical protein